MCGRFYDIFDLDDIMTRFRVSQAPSEPLPLRYNLAPTQTAPVIRFDGDERELTLMRWGLIPRWILLAK
jgi:putative SOS response-associated peptidase YedK